MNPQLLARLSTLLDEALELDEPAREAWLAELESTSAPLAPALHELLGRLASKETACLLDQVPAFTAAGEVAAAAVSRAGDAIGPDLRVPNLRAMPTGPLHGAPGAGLPACLMGSSSTVSFRATQFAVRAAVKGRVREFDAVSGRHSSIIRRRSRRQRSRSCSRDFLAGCRQSATSAGFLKPVIGTVVL